MIVRTAIVQMCSRKLSPAHNLDLTIARAMEARAQGARFVVFPELAISGYTLDGPGLGAIAETLEGPSIKGWCALSAQTGLWIAGGFCERDGDALFNSAVLIGPAGIALHYRKLHLFDREKLVFTPGDKGLRVVDTEIGRIGLCVCYDLRFVEVLRGLALSGAEIVAVPTAWVDGFDPKPRDAMGYIGQARGAIVQANLNQVFVACASQSGKSDEISFLGSSLVAGPYGDVLAGPLGADEERVELADIDTSAVQSAQIRSPLVRPREDRRVDVYGLQLGGNLM